MSTPNPARQRLMGPLDYLAAMAGAQPRPQAQPPQMPMVDPAGQRVPANPPLPMPFADFPPNATGPVHVARTGGGF